MSLIRTGLILADYLIPKKQYSEKKPKKKQAKEHRDAYLKIPFHTQNYFLFKL